MFSPVSGNAIRMRFKGASPTMTIKQSACQLLITLPNPLKHLCFLLASSIPVGSGAALGLAAVKNLDSYPA
jgi:hypothetical protein